MNKLYYTGKGKNDDNETILPLPRRTDLLKPEKYIPDQGLVDAANVALVLGQPLLLTGEAGTGKTQFAYNLSWELGLDLPFKFEVKSNSMAKDLFYTYDALKRFQDIQSGSNPKTILNYLSFQALGTAILRTRKWAENKDLISDDSIKTEVPTRSVVLIDEIDKAPRDFPNDILNEIENMYFRIPELGNKLVEADRDLPPIIIITSNSEKDLPDAFLRRCAYYNIPFPEKERLKDIVANRLGTFVGGADEFVDDAIDIFFKLRDEANGLRKKPSTSEMLGWLMALKELAFHSKNPLRESDIALRTLSNLIKTTNDQEIGGEIIRKWLMERN